MCEVDGRCFTSNKGRNYHKKLHGEKVFKCDQCSQVFSTKNNLTTHKTRDLHAETMFSCEKCKECFTIKKNLERHVKSKHEKNTNLSGKISLKKTLHQMQKETE